MRLLTVGIDAVVPGLFESFQLPFYSSLKKKSFVCPIEEDLIDRGWAKMFTGMGGGDTKALYMYPALDGTYRHTDECNLSLIQNACRNVEFLWEKLNRKGYRVGIMNIPTTSPAPEVNGFFVSGGGGGISKMTNIPKNLISHNCIASTLDEVEYIVDVRLTQSGIKDFREYFKILRSMTEKRVFSFLKLKNQIPVDYGFICFRSMANINYLALANLRNILKNGIKSDFDRHLVDYLFFFDKQLEILFNEISPISYMVVSDHSVVPKTHEVNLNEFLSMTAFQQKVKSKSEVKKILNKARLKTPWFIKKLLKGNRLVVNSYFSNMGFDRNKTEAFTLPVIPGIFINDHRFSGPVRQEKKESIINNICEKALEHPEFKVHDIFLKKAFYCEDKKKYTVFKPDILIQNPKGVVEVSIGPMVTKLNREQSLKNLDGVYDDNWTGTKGKATEFFVSSDLSELLENCISDDLKVVYELVEKVME